MRTLGVVSGQLCTWLTDLRRQRFPAMALASHDPGSWPCPVGRFARSVGRL